MNRHTERQLQQARIHLSDSWRAQAEAETYYTLGNNRMTYLKRREVYYHATLAADCYKQAAVFASIYKRFYKREALGL